MDGQEYIPRNRADKIENDPADIAIQREYFAREYAIAVEEVKIMQEKLRECFIKSGVNQYEDCKELRESLWKKIHTPNYGAPGPPRDTSKYF
mmetsp:Transcript_46561/g.76948  ORF Transcript_46561/g.76948 Transcript_46561/m.76948 type:complete len:92 (+) Transcript_46561:69-344(+)|eukprot:CAMPEP_0119331452 /NCGR_PEP_ID=MMETSP1333-20130426/80657_1 /TAXON_ID=418940 /ORGANISM="Scyphosphaera apsteinii, Strain RCC1455" /LENGTH=91 /DNA_ID=CAMNT_0007341063 /DNA_START=69 /DNA_END=344 /DNA_ORIENTATION=-